MNNPGIKRAEIVIVGGGVIGAATAYELGRRGASVTLIERHAPAAGASGTNMGFLWTQGKAADLHFDVVMASRKRYDELALEIDDFELKTRGGMIYFFEEQAGPFAQFVASRREMGLPMELLDAATARDRCPVLPEDVGGAVWNPLDAHVNPPLVTGSLIAAAQRHGVKVLTGTEVTGLDVSGGVCRGVRTTGGGIAADTVILATGTWAPALLEPLGVHIPIEPMRLQVLETDPIDLRFDPVLYGPSGIKGFALSHDLEDYDEELFTHPMESVIDGVEMIEVIGQRRDGSLMIGSPADFAGFDDRPTVAGVGLMLAVIADHLPALRDAKVRRTWAGLMPQTPDGKPVMDRVPGIDGLIVAAGHMFGQMMGPWCGQFITRMVYGEQAGVDATQFRFDRW
jgi:glycine/D-amino acid oxidase-like deaminating enzyme